MFRLNPIIALLLLAAVSAGAADRAGSSKVDPTKEGLDTALTPGQFKKVRAWMGSSKNQLLQLLEDIELMTLSATKAHLLAQITAIVRASDPKAAETMMRYSLNRGVDIVNQMDQDHFANPARPGVLNQEVRILKRTIGFALEYYQNDLLYFNAIENGAGDPDAVPMAEFGIRCAQFMMKLDRSLVSSRAQYKIALDTLGRLSVDLYNDDRKSDFGDAVGKIYLFQKAHKKLPETSPEAIAGLRVIEEEFQQVLQSLALTELKGSIVNDEDVATE